jgi:hypothetical protein
MKALFLALLLPLTASAAIFEGKFTGTGVAVMREKRKCSEIFLQFERAPTQLKTLEGGYNCEDLDASFDPFTLDVKDGQIFSNGKAVGTLTDSLLDLFYDDKAEGFTYHWRLELKGGALDYREEWVSGGKTELTVTGTLKAIL